MTVLIEPTTNPATSRTIKAGNEARWVSPSVPVTLYLSGLPIGGDKITVQYQDGATWRDFKMYGTEIALNADTNIQTIYGPLTFRLSKGATTAAIGATIETVRGV